MQTAIDDLQQQKANALKLLKGDSSTRAKALRSQIEAIDPTDATRREKDQLAALCRKVGVYHAGLPKKQFGRQPTFDSRLRTQNPRGSRGRHG